MKSKQPPDPHIEAMALGRGIAVPNAAQPAVAAWIMKTNLTAMLTTKEWERLGNLYPEFRSERKPTVHHHISVTGYSGERWSSLFHFQPITILPNNDGDSGASRIDGYYFTLLVGHLVTQVIYLPTSVSIAPADYLHVIWPTGGDFIWPGGIISAELFEVFAKTSLVGNDGMPPASLAWNTLV